MSDQLTVASDSMGVPEPLVERAARAWATAAGSSYEDVLAAWGGGGSVSAAPASAQAEATEDAPVGATAPATDASPEAPETPTEPVAPAEPVAVPVAAAIESEPDEVVAPLPLGERISTAARIGSWTGAALGLLGFVIGSTWLLGNASVSGEEGSFAPAVEVMSSRVLIGVALMSVVFGVVVATLSRAALAWMNPGARLNGRNGLTVVLGAALGLGLGVAAGGVMVSAFSTPVEGAEGVVIMDVVPSIILVLIGGALLGAATAALIQLVGVPVGIGADDAADIDAVRKRLSAAVSIPVAAALLLALLVVPLGLTFIRSNELTAGGAAILAILAAISILGIATLAASRPEMKISFGEFLVAVAGIGTVVVILFSVFSSRAEPEEAAEEGDTTEQEAEDGESTDTTIPTDTSVPEAAASQGGAA